MLLATALALLITGCVFDALLFKQTTKGSTKGSSSFLLFLNWAEENRFDAAKICGGAENVVKTETQQTFVKWISFLVLLL